MVETAWKKENPCCFIIVHVQLLIAVSKTLLTFLPLPWWPQWLLAIRKEEERGASLPFMLRRPAALPGSPEGKLGN